MTINEKNKAVLITIMFFLTTFFGLVSFLNGYFLASAIIFSIVAIFSEMLVQYSNVEPNDFFVNTIIQKLGLK